MPTYSLVAFKGEDSLKGSIEYSHGEVHLIYDWQDHPLSKEETPALGESIRKVGLWEDTCFEAFFLQENGEYQEWNFSLTGAWNAFQFLSYRKARDPWEIPSLNPPQILREREKDRLVITFESLPFKAFQLSAVIANKELEYYAISHPQSKADFHSLDHFTPWSPQ